MSIGACLLAGQVALAASGFTLGWTHSIEHTGWREFWHVEGDALVLDRAAVRGSGAGMEPGDDAHLQDGWWVWPVGRRVPQVMLAASGATGAGWTLCTDAGCRVLGAQAGAPITLRPCDADPPRPDGRP